MSAEQTNKKQTKSKRRVVLVVIGVVLILVATIGFKFFRDYQKYQAYLANQKPPVYTVSTSVAKEVNWTPYIPSIGTVQAVQGVDITNQEAGVIQSINFKSGQFVNKGELLVQLDPSVLDAQLQQAIASMKLAKVTYDRDNALYKQKAVSSSTLDTSLAQYVVEKAKVAQMKAQVDRMKITAPFSGKIGIRQIDLGQYLSAGTVVTNLQTIDPVLVDFNVPEKDISKVFLGQKINVRVDAYPDQTFEGKLTAVDARVDENSRGLKLQATVPNTHEKHRLYPGMFVSVRLYSKTSQKVIEIPQTAINYTLYGNSVFVAENDQVKRVYVDVGERIGDQIVILKGLKAGQTVVSAGQLKLQNGSHIKVDNAIRL